MQNMEVHCCLCNDSCNPGDDLKNHLRKEHDLKQASLAKYVKQLMGEETDSNDVDDSDDIMSLESQPVEPNDDIELTEEFKHFVEQEIAECIESLFTNLVDEAVPITPSSIEAESITPSSIEDLNVCFDDIRNRIQNMDIPLSFHNDVQKEFEERTGNKSITQKSKML